MQLKFGIKRHCHARASAPSPWDGARKGNRPAELLSPGCDIQGMQAVRVRPGFLSLSHDIDCLTDGVDYRRAGDAHLGHHVGISEVRTELRGSPSRGTMSSVEQGDLPERFGVCPQVAVRIERIHAIVLSGHEHHVVLGAGLRRAGAHGDVCHVKRLCVHVAIYNIIKDFSKRAGIYVGRRQNRLGGIGAGASIVVVLSCHVLRLGAERKEQQCPSRAKNQARAHFFCRVQGRHAVLLRLSQLWQKLDRIGYCRLW